MTQYKFDALRYCRNNAGRLQLPDGSDPMERIAEELRLAMELREAVAWERECDAFIKGKDCSFHLAWEHLQAARAEVDRLLEEGEG